ncbi:MAG: hypothetical protein ACRDWG_14940 [Actinomycetes bacterium]
MGRWLIDVGDDGWIIVYDAKTRATLYTIRIEDVEARTGPGQRLLPRRRARRFVYN